METTHRFLEGDASDLGALDDGSIDLVVTSPPYPMIEMWDDAFAAQDPGIGDALAGDDAWRAFDAMHAILDRAWQAVHRVLAPGGLACVDIGDATRTLGDRFALYPNHARALAGLRAAGFAPLPAILWRKPTNAPSKFMGSGMLPPGAYVTLEHEVVLVVRKGDKRAFASDAARRTRRRSAYFWEERNAWFSDVWTDLRGTGQALDKGSDRARSGAFPFELPYRLVQMFSVIGDTVLDPFAGTGTTLLAAAASGRHSVGVDRVGALADTARERLADVAAIGRARVDSRLDAHRTFVRARHAERGAFGYRSARYGFPVVTKQEVDLELVRPHGVSIDPDGATRVTNDTTPPADESDAWAWFFDDVRSEARPSRS